MEIEETLIYEGKVEVDSSPEIYLNTSEEDIYLEELFSFLMNKKVKITIDVYGQEYNSTN